MIHVKIAIFSPYINSGTRNHVNDVIVVRSSREIFVERLRRGAGGSWKQRLLMAPA